jgi:hypothetical protein
MSRVLRYLCLVCKVSRYQNLGVDMEKPQPWNFGFQINQSSQYLEKERSNVLSSETYTMSTQSTPVPHPFDPTKISISSVHIEFTSFYVGPEQRRAHL